jgi:hypothetical protein
MVRKWPEIITTCTSIFVISYFKTVQRSSSRVVLVMKRWCGAEVFGDFRSFIIGVETYSLQRTGNAMQLLMALLLLFVDF